VPWTSPFPPTAERFERLEVVRPPAGLRVLEICEAATSADVDPRQQLVAVIGEGTLTVWVCQDGLQDGL
jgi:hypothetical protein